MTALHTPFIWLAALSAAFAAPDREGLIARIETRALSNWHYAPPQFDTAYSRSVFDLYLKRLDPQKRFLLQSDADSLSRFRDSLAAQLQRGDYSLCELANALLGKRIEEMRIAAREILKSPPSLKRDDSILTESDKLGYSRNSAELRMLWEKLMRYQILARLGDKRLELADKDSNVAVKKRKKIPLPDSSAIREAANYVARNLDRSLGRMIREERLDRAAVLFNAAANALDPHTEYFKPEAREEFNLAMSGTLEGIGAVLREDDGFIKVVSIVPGSASWRQKELKAEDKILKVGQVAEEPVDIVNASVQEAVRLIRGKKGTEVRLTVEHANGQTQIIPIVRDVVVVDEAYAKSAIIQPPGTKLKLGYIAVPSFYRDFQKPEGRNSSTDVKVELDKLKAKNIQGVIIDLRGNGGGALEDAVKMAGLFLPGGPVVQVKDRRGSTGVLEDTEPDVVFTGPLVVMVNSFSASASEIMAAAMQDYGRAVIVGSDTTFGKGTVQTVADLDNLAGVEGASFKPLGSVKLTVQKFYRVSGGSTQFRGVVPDVLIPDGYTYLEIGEKSLEHPLPWDTVKALNVTERGAPPMALLQQKSGMRLSKSPYFKRVNTFLKRQAGFQNRKAMPLSMVKFFAERDANRRESDELEDLEKKTTGLTVDVIPRPNAPVDSVEREKVKSWQEQLGRDMYLHEAADVLLDLTAAEAAPR